MLIERVQSIPTKAVKQPGRVILAHGEVTGHAHEIDQDQAEAWKVGEELTIKVRKAAPITHQEHAPIPLTPGYYKITRQREYSPEAIRNVAD